MTRRVHPDWIAVDWGTSNLRAWAMTDDGDVLANARSADGMGSLAPDQFEPALLAIIAGWLGDAAIKVVACGMLGAMQGWVNAPYASTPCAPLSTEFAKPPANRPGLQVHIVPGISQNAPADVMRGEETQIAGFLAGQPDFDGVICLPGTHTKWVHISAGEIVSFQTYLTGELFSVIANNTVLRHSIALQGWDEAAFMSALDGAISRPQRLASDLFALRAGALLHDLDGAGARARLSGLLIGAELASARPYWLGRDIMVLGDGQLAQYYANALKSLGANPQIQNVEQLTLIGLRVAYQHIRGTT